MCVRHSGGNRTSREESSIYCQVLEAIIEYFDFSLLVCQDTNILIKTPLFHMSARQIESLTLFDMVCRREELRKGWLSWRPSCDCRVAWDAVFWRGRTIK